MPARSKAEPGTLRTERLVLSPVTVQLAGAVLAGSAAAAAPGFPSWLDQCLLARAADGHVVPHSYLVRQAGEMVGTVGASGPLEADGSIEIGYALVPAARGRGLATEAVAALCTVLDQQPGAQRLVALVEPDNASSLRLLARLGFLQTAGRSTSHLTLVRAVPGAPAVRPRIAGRHVC